jgi:hypothetical protein
MELSLPARPHNDAITTDERKLKSSPRKHMARYKCHCFTCGVRMMLAIENGMPSAAHSHCSRKCYRDAIANAFPQRLGSPTGTTGMYRRPCQNVHRFSSSDIRGTLLRHKVCKRISMFNLRGYQFTASGFATCSVLVWDICVLLRHFCRPIIA